MKNHSLRKRSLVNMEEDVFRYNHPVHFDENPVKQLGQEAKTIQASVK